MTFTGVGPVVVEFQGDIARIAFAAESAGAKQLVLGADHGKVMFGLGLVTPVGLNIECAVRGHGIAVEDGRQDIDAVKRQIALFVDVTGCQQCGRDVVVGGQL